MTIWIAKSCQISRKSKGSDRGESTMFADMMQTWFFLADMTTPTLRSLVHRSQKLIIPTRQILTPKQLNQREHLHHFLKGAWDVLEPRRTLEDNWHLELIAEYLELLSSGELKKILINIAPRSLKSIECSVAYPCWEWIHYPERRFLCLSYSASLANDLSDLRRSLIRSEWYQSLTQGSIRLSTGDRNSSQSVKNRVSEFANNHRGQMVARGFDGTVTGSGGDRLIVDDPNNPDIGNNPELLAKTEKRFRDYSFGRRNSKDAGILVIQQRCARRDVSGVIKDILDQGDWTILTLPTCSKIYTEIRFPKSDRLIIRNSGDFLIPTRHGATEDDEAKQVLGSVMYASRHDQNPQDEESQVFKVPRAVPALPVAYQLALSVDSTFGSTSRTASFACVGLWAIARPNFYLIKVWRKRTGVIQTKQAIKDMIQQHQNLGVVPTILIELKANGSSLIEELELELPGIIPVSPRESKRARAEAIAPLFESGNIFLLDDPSWTTDYLIELADFPNGANDDQVDMTSQLVAYYLQKWRRSQSQIAAASVSLKV